MAEKFYTLEEVAEKLGKTVEEIQQFVEDGKLHEIRDGSKVTFKAEDVESLVSDTSLSLEAADEETVELTSDETGEISLAPEVLADTGSSVFDLPGGKEFDITDESDLDITKESTSLTGEPGINVLGETDTTGLDIADDTLSETKLEAESQEPERLDEDINLDSFGSGSGLLDLSLQADDTSLGAVLDDIYPTEGEQVMETPEQESSGVAESILAEVDTSTAEPMEQAPAVMAAYVEPEADKQSNLFGITLFVPLVFLLYTVIIAIGGVRGVPTTLLKMAQNIIWFAVIGASVIVMLLAGIALVMGGKGEKKAKPKQEVYQKEEPKEAPEKAEDEAGQQMDETVRFDELDESEEPTEG